MPETAEVDVHVRPCSCGHPLTFGPLGVGPGVFIPNGGGHATIYEGRVLGSWQAEHVVACPACSRKTTLVEFLGPPKEFFMGVPLEVFAGMVERGEAKPIR